jgi:hypothetical protein
MHVTGLWMSPMWQELLQIPTSFTSIPPGVGVLESLGEETEENAIPVLVVPFVTYQYDS